LLPRLRAAALADPGVAGQRLVELLVGELAGGPVRRGEEGLLVGVRLPGQDVVRPARDRETGEQDLAGGLDLHQQNPGTASHASPEGGASSRTTWASIRPYGRSAAMKTSPSLVSPSTRNCEKSTRKWCLLGAEKRISASPWLLLRTALPIRCSVSCNAREYVV